MKLWAVVEHDQPLELIERADPVPVGAEILLKVRYCGVCHSDVHFQHGAFDLGKGQTLKITDRGAKLPCAPGHEIVGEVIALGPDASGVAIGDVRIVYPWVGCGTCELCLSDRENLCYTPRGIGVVQDGGFGTHVVVRNASYLIEFGNLDPAFAATLACSGLTVYSAIQKLMPMSPDAPVMLVGAGGLGLLALATLKAVGHRNIIVADVGAEKRAAALAGGALHVIDNASPDALDQVREAAGGFLSGVIDFVNMRSTVDLGFEALGKSGKLILVGIGGGDYTLSLAGIVFRPRDIRGSITGNRRELREVIDLALAGKLAAPPVRRMPKDAANEALDLLRDGKVIGRLVLEDVGQ